MTPSTRPAPPGCNARRLTRHTRTPRSATLSAHGAEPRSSTSMTASVLGTLVREHARLVGGVGLHAPVPVQVVRRDVEQHGDLGAEPLGERELETRDLGHEHGRRAGLGGHGHGGTADVADGLGGHAPLGEEVGDERRGGRLAVGPGDRDPGRAGHPPVRTRSRSTIGAPRARTAVMSALPEGCPGSRRPGRTHPEAASWRPSRRPRRATAGARPPPRRGLPRPGRSTVTRTGSPACGQTEEVLGRGAAGAAEPQHEHVAGDVFHHDFLVSVPTKKSAKTRAGHDRRDDPEADHDLASPTSRSSRSGGAAAPSGRCAFARELEGGDLQDHRHDVSSDVDAADDERAAARSS